MDANRIVGSVNPFPVPVIHMPEGPRLRDPRNVAVLTDLSNLLAYARIPRRKVVAVWWLLAYAVEFQDQDTWDKVIWGLQSETAEDGFRSHQSVAVMTAEQSVKFRSEWADSLLRAGPGAKEAPKDERR